jgi:hypothetical protein
MHLIESRPRPIFGQTRGRANVNKARDALILRLVSEGECDLKDVVAGPAEVFAKFLSAGDLRPENSSKNG